MELANGGSVLRAVNAIPAPRFHFPQGAKSTMLREGSDAGVLLSFTCSSPSLLLVSVFVPHLTCKCSNAGQLTEGPVPDLAEDQQATYSAQEFNP